MPKSTGTAHPVKSRDVAPRVTENSDARRQALDWLAGELRWERALGAVRAQSAGRRVRG